MRFYFKNTTNYKSKPKHKLKMKRVSETVITQAKRKRLFLKYREGPLIEPFLNLYPLLQPPFPSLNDQNILFEQFEHLCRIPEIGELVKEANTPFVTKYCEQCKCSKLLHEFPFFTDPAKGIRRSRLKIPSICQSCNSVNINAAKRQQYTPEEKKELVVKLNKMIEKAHRDNSDLNMAHMHRKCMALIKIGAKETIDLIFREGADKQVKCNTCKEDKYLYAFRTDVKCRDGVRPKCTECSVKNSAEVRIISGMKARMNQDDNGVCLQSLWDEKMRGQNNTCFLSLLPFRYEFGHPFKASPERVDRANPLYNNDNMVLILNILNVGGGFNFTRRLILQTILADKLDTMFHLYDKKATRRFVKVQITSAAQRSKRRSNGIRSDSAFEFDIDYRYIMAVLNRQGFRCAISKLPLVPKWKHPWSMSIDRIDDTKGYVRGNVRLVVARYNASKTWTQDLCNTFFPHITENREKILDLFKIETQLNFESCDDPNLLTYLSENL